MNTKFIYILVKKKPKFWKFVVTCCYNIERLYIVNLRWHFESGQQSFCVVLVVLLFLFCSRVSNLDWFLVQSRLFSQKLPNPFYKWPFVVNDKKVGQSLFRCFSAAAASVRCQALNFFPFYLAKDFSSVNAHFKSFAFSFRSCFYSL